MKVIKYISLLTILALVVSCQPKELNPKDYVSWVKNPDKGLVKVQEISGFVFTAEYLPAEIIALEEQRNSLNNIDKDIFKADLENQKQVLQFKINLASKEKSIPFLKTNINSMEEYHHRINYFNDQVTNDLEVYIGMDTLQCKYSLYERMYNLANYNTLLCVFETTKVDINEDISLVMNGEILGLGPVRFLYKASNLQKIPALKL